MTRRNFTLYTRETPDKPSQKGKIVGQVTFGTPYPPTMGVPKTKFFFLNLPFHLNLIQLMAHLKSNIFNLGPLQFYLYCNVIPKLYYLR